MFELYHSKCMCTQHTHHRSPGIAHRVRIVQVGGMHQIPHRPYPRPARVVCVPNATATTQSSPVIPYVPHNKPRIEAQPGQPPIIILPGFGNCSEDYTAPFGDAPSSVVTALQLRGFSVFVPPLKRTDWFNVARSLLTTSFWTTSCTTDPGYRWYLDRVHAAVESARRVTDSETVDLVGHSAGGWLARAYLADPKYFQETCHTRGCRSAVRTLCTLGTPHSPPPADCVRDMTGGALTWVNKQWPGAFHEKVRYVSVAGVAVEGDEAAAPRTLCKYAHNSYTQGHKVAGDAVVPVESALLEGSEHVLLQGVFHSMSRVGTYSEASDFQWYGSAGVVDAWLDQLV